MSDSRTIITSVVAHIDHGKTTLIDSLVAQQGKISKSLARDMKYMDTREDEQKRGITLKLSAISLKRDNTEHMILDTPGHVDFEFLIENSSILSDCFLIIIDIMEGITPRTYSIINYIRSHYTVLVINKLDKVDTYDDAVDKIERIISFINSMVGNPVFSWDNNNIILSSATYCYGINYKSSAVLLKKEVTNIEIVTRFIFYIEDQINKKYTEKICKKFKIKKISRKNILSTVMPLAETIFDSIEHVYRPDTFTEYLYDSSVPLVLKEKIRQDQTLCFVSLGIFQNNKQYDKSNLMFVTRLFQGNISKGNVLYSSGNYSYEINSLIKFGINDFIEVESVSGSTLVCIKADLKKNKPLFSDNSVSFLYLEKIYPFYRSTLIPENRENIEEIKDILRAIVHTEQCLRIKINKYNQIDVLSSGNVQVEKMIEDLKACDILVKEGLNENLFCEYPKEKANYHVENEKFSLSIQIYKNENTGYDGYIDEFNNRFVVLHNQMRNLILSILEIYVVSGPAISEYIRDTTFMIDFKLKDVSLDDDVLYSQIKSHIKNAYIQGSPSIAPFFYKLNISIQEEYLCGLYNSLQKFPSLLLSEDYDEDISFYVLCVLIPHFSYDLYIEDVRICTKGTAYILSSEFGYFYDMDFSDYIGELRKKKGLQTDEKIIINPEKQRTLKK